MRPFFIQEPELQFGQGRHIDIRFGITAVQDGTDL